MSMLTACLRQTEATSLLFTNYEYECNFLAHNVDGSYTEYCLNDAALRCSLQFNQATNNT